MVRSPSRPIGSVLLFHRSKLVVDNNEIIYWKKMLFKPPCPVKTQLVSSTLMRERIDCREHTLRLLSFLYYDAQSMVIEYVPEAEKEGAPTLPETRRRSVRASLVRQDARIRQQQCPQSI